MFGQAVVRIVAMVLFGLLLDRVGLGVLAVSAGLGLASTAALLALRTPHASVHPRGDA